MQTSYERAMSIVADRRAGIPMKVVAHKHNITPCRAYQIIAKLQLAANRVHRRGADEYTFTPRSQMIEFDTIAGEDASGYLVVDAAPGMRRRGRKKKRT